jgi:hypothetical protein
MLFQNKKKYGEEKTKAKVVNVSTGVSCRKRKECLGNNYTVYREPLSRPSRLQYYGQAVFHSRMTTIALIYSN